MTPQIDANAETLNWKVMHLIIKNSGLTLGWPHQGVMQVFLCPVFAAWLLGSELQVPSEDPSLCLWPHRTAQIFLWELSPKIQELSQRGEQKKMVLDCLRVARSFRRPLWKILMKMSVLNFFFFFFFTDQLHNCFWCSPAHFHSSTLPPTPKVFLMFNALRFCKNLDTSSPPLHMGTHQTCVFFLLVHFYMLQPHLSL